LSITNPFFEKMSNQVDLKHHIHYTPTISIKSVPLVPSKLIYYKEFAVNATLNYTSYHRLHPNILTTLRVNCSVVRKLGEVFCTVIYKICGSSAIAFALIVY